jgi:hypothetical protein
VATHNLVHSRVAECAACVFCRFCVTDDHDPDEMGSPARSQQVITPKIRGAASAAREQERIIETARLSNLQHLIRMAAQEESQCCTFFLLAAQNCSAVNFACPLIIFFLPVFFADHDSCRLCRQALQIFGCRVQREKSWLQGRCHAGHRYIHCCVFGRTLPLSLDV